MLSPASDGRPAGASVRTALAKSVARVPETIDAPAVNAASPSGAALDLIAQYEIETETGS
jgi:hypothetical protein